MTSNATALVTGAHGFIGRHVARALAHRGVSVHGIGHGDWTDEERRAWGVSSWTSSDVTVDALLRLRGDFDTIVHCAGSGSVALSMTDPRLDFERTVVTTSAVLELARRAHGVRVVLPSSGSVYGAVSAGAVSERQAPSPQSPYAVHKLLAEQLCEEYGRFFAVAGSIVRLFSVYGPGLRKQLLWDACSKISDGRAAFGGTGDECRDFIHVEDAAELLIAAAGYADDRFPVVNGGTGLGTAIRDVVALIASELGYRGAVEFTGEARPGNPSRFVADPARACAWGWSPRTEWRDGVRAYCRWYEREATAG